MDKKGDNRNAFTLPHSHREGTTVTVQFDGFLGKSPKPVIWTVSLTLDQAIQFADRNGDIAAGPILQQVLELTK